MRSDDIRTEVTAVFFSPNGTTGKWTRAVAEGAVRALSGRIRFLDITACYKTAVKGRDFGKEELLVVGVPVYVGYAPSPAVSFLKTIRGMDTPCILIASYGNRDYGKCLFQMERVMREQGFIPVAAAAFSSQHCVAADINAGRPDAGDLEEAYAFGEKAGNMLLDPGYMDTALRPGEIPEGKAMNQEDILSAFPAVPVMTSVGELPKEPPRPGLRCTDCGICQSVCPTGALDRRNKGTEPYMCLVCCACIRKCPQKTLDFAQPAFSRFQNMCVEKFGMPRRGSQYFLHEP